MTFAKDMLAMTSLEVKQAVVHRLVEHSGVPYDTARGEPVWALLVSSFSHWRADPANLKAVDDALAELVPKAFDEQRWAVVQDACDFMVALADQTDGWLPPSSRKWPYEDWLKAPTNPSGKTDAAIAALHLMRHADRVNKPWLDQLFRAACHGMSPDPTRVQAAWLIECWKVVVILTEGKKERGLSLPLFDMFSAAGKPADERERARMVRAAISWAWLLFKPKEREGLAAAVRKAIEDFDDAGFIKVMLRVEEEELPAKGRPEDWLTVIRTFIENPNPSSSPMDRLRIAPVADSGLRLYRESKSWQTCPA